MKNQQIHYFKTILKKGIVMIVLYPNYLNNLTNFKYPKIT
jgi:hypothetical protein